MTDQSKEEAILADLSRIITSAPKAEDVYELFIERLRDLIEFDRAVIAIVQPDGNSFIDTLVSGIEISEWEQGKRHLLDGTVTQFALSQGQPVIGSEDIIISRLESTSSKTDQLNSDLLSIISVPIYWQQNPVGVFHLRSKKANTYSADDARVLERVSSQIAGAIANNNLREETAQEGERRAMIAGIGRAVSGSLSFEEISAQIRELIAGTIRFDRFAVSNYDAETDNIRNVFACDFDGAPANLAPDSVLSDYIGASSLTSFKPYVMGWEALSEAYSSDSYLLTLQDAGIRSGVWIPLRWNDQLVGAMAVASKSATPLTPDQVQFLEQIASHVAGAMEASRLHARTLADADRRTAMAEISRTVGSTLDIESIALRTAVHLDSFIHFDRLSLASIDFKAKTVRTIWNSVGSDDPDFAVGVEREYIGTFLEQALEGQSAVTVFAGLDASSDPSIISNKFTIRFVDDGPEHTFILAPIWLREVPIGCLYLRSDGFEHVSRENVMLLDDIASQLAPIIQYSRLHAIAINESARRTTLAEIGRIFSSGYELDTDYEEFVPAVQKIIPFDRLVVSQLNVEEDGVVDEFVWGDASETALPNQRYVLSDTPAIKLVEEMSPLIWNAEEMDGDKERFAVVSNPVKMGLLSALIAPIIWEGQIIGTLNFRSRQDRAYNQKQVEIVEQIATQIAGAIENTRLHKRTRLEALERTVLAEIGRTASSSLEAGEIYAELASHISQLMNFDRMVMSTIDRTRSTAQSAFIFGVEIKGDSGGRNPIPLAESPINLTIEANAPVHLNHAEISEFTNAFSRLNPILEAGLVSALHVPLRWDDEIIGSLDFRSKTENAYSDTDFGIANLIAEQIVGPFANSALHKDLARSEAGQTALAKLGRHVSELSDAGDVFEAVGKTMAEFVAFDRISINKLEMNPTNMVLRYQDGIQIESHEIGAQVLVEAGLETITAWATKSPTDAPHHYQSTKTEAFLALGLKSTMRAPMRTRDHLVGVIAVNSKKADPFTQNDFQLLNRAAEQVAAIVDNLDLIANAETQAHEQSEFARLARELSSASTREEMFRLTDQAVSGFFNSDRLSISVLNPETMDLKLVFGRGLEIPEVPVGSVFHIGNNMKGFNDWASDLTSPIPTALDTPKSDQFTLLGLKTTMRAPLRTASGSVGVIALNSYHPDAYSTKDHELLGLIAVQLAPALENMDLYRAAQGEALERTALAEIGRIITASLDMSEVYERFETQARRLIEFDRFSISTIGVDEGVLIPQYVSGVPVRGEAMGPRLPYSISGTNRVVETGLPVVMTHDEVNEMAADDDG